MEEDIKKKLSLLDIVKSCLSNMTMLGSLQSGGLEGQNWGPNLTLLKWSLSTSLDTLILLWTHHAPT